jgi:hypothetical protein
LRPFILVVLASFAIVVIAVAISLASQIAPEVSA